MWLVYMVRCADGTLYTGITNDVLRRLAEHNTDNRSGSKYVRTRRPVTLVYTETSPNRSDASKREAQIKHLSRKHKLLLVESSLSP